jgi:hypothetical protein
MHTVFHTLMARQTSAGAFRFRTDSSRSLMRVVEIMTNGRASLFKLPYGDQGLFMRRTVFESAGGFPCVPIAEDLYLVRRLSRKGRIKIAPAAVITSARRWHTLGIVRTTCINQLILGGCILGLSPEKLAPLYGLRKSRSAGTGVDTPLFSSVPSNRA